MGIPNLQNSGTKTKVAVNTLSQIIGKILTGGSTFLISLLIARNYGTSGYGDFIKVTTLVAVFYLFTDFGLNAIYLQREKSDQPQNHVWTSLFSLRVIIGIGLLIFLLILLPFLPGHGNEGYTNIVKLGIILFSPTILFQSLTTTANAVFQKTFRYDLATLAILAGSLVSLLLVWVSTLVFLPTVALFVILLSLGIGSFITAFISLRLAHPPTLAIQLSFKSIKTLLYPAIPLGITLILNLIYFRADTFILTVFRTTSEVGVYGFAYKIFEFALIIPTYFMNSVYPLMLTRNTTGTNHQPDILPVMKKSIAILLPVSLVVTVGLWFAAPFITYLKQDFAGSILALRILTVGLPFFFLSSLTMWSIIALSKQKYLLYIYGISMTINIIANFFFIPRYSYLAAAWITVGSEAIVLLMSGVVMIRILRTA